MSELMRYAKIHTKFPREFVLLQGRGCVWKKCTYCDYYLDACADPSVAFARNSSILAQVTGEFGVLDIINSGSAPELDQGTLSLAAQIVREKRIRTLWFEAHYLYREKLDGFARQFTPATVKFRCGVETFHGQQRTLWNKGIGESVTPKELARYFQGVCLLCCVQGQTKEDILTDIAIAKDFFEYASVNVFCHNSTATRRDENLFRWFSEDVYPQLAEDPQVEVLLENSDLGVG